MKRLLLLMLLAASLCFGRSFVTSTSSCTDAHSQIAQYMQTQPYFVAADSTPSSAVYNAAHADADGNTPSLVFDFVTLVPKSKLQSTAVDEMKLKAGLMCDVFVTQKNTRAMSVGWCPFDDGTLDRSDPVLIACQNAHMHQQSRINVGMMRLHEDNAVRAFRYGPFAHKARGCDLTDTCSKR